MRRKWEHKETYGPSVSAHNPASLLFSHPGYGLLPAVIPLLSVAGARQRERGKQGGLIALQHVTQQQAGSDPTHQETLRATAALCCTGHEHVLHDSSGMKPVWYCGAHQEKCILGVTTPQGMSPPCLPLLEGMFQHVSLRSLCCLLYLESTALDGKSSISFVFDLCQQASAKPAR